MLRNLSQEWVLNTIEECIKENKDPFWSHEGHSNDLACYVLNRIKPVYINSSRGFLHKELKKELQKQADLLTLISEGMQIIPHRRTQREEEPSSESEPYGRMHEENGTNRGNGAVQREELREIPWDKNFYFHFPSIFGKIILEDSFKEVAEAKITLMMQYQDQLIQSPMVSKQWENPFHVSIHTQYYYTFYPQSIPTQKGANAREIFYFILRISDKDLEIVQEEAFQIELGAVSTSGLNRSFLHEVKDIHLKMK